MFRSNLGMHVEFENSSEAKDFYDDFLLKSGWDAMTVERSIQLDHAFVIFTAPKWRTQQVAE